MIYLLIVALIIVIGTVSYGFVKRAKDEIEGKKAVKKALKINLGVFIPIVVVAIFTMVPQIARAATDGQIMSSPVGLGYIGAALCTGLASIGAGYAVGAVGSSALGAVSEDPKILGKTLIFVGLAEGIVIYGLVISIMILMRLQ